MNLKIYNEKQEDDLYLRLVQYQNKIRVEVVDNTGTRITSGALLSIGLENGITLCSNVNSKINLPLDRYGKIIITDRFIK